MAANLYTQHYADGTSKLVRRSIRQGRKPSGLGKIKSVRLRLESEARMQDVKAKLGYLYNENEFIRNSVDHYLNSVWTELLKH